MKKNLTAAFTLGLVVVGIIVLSASAFTVTEGQQAIVTQFGEIQRSITDAGLHFKTPFVQEVRFLEKRILEFDGDPDDTQTNDKKPISLDTFARWRIKDPEQFYRSVRTEREARSRLDAIINSAIRETIARYLLVEAVRNSNRPLTQDKEIAEVRQQIDTVEVQTEGLAGEAAEILRVAEGNVEIKMGREKLMAEILASAGRQVEQLGIELTDVKIKRLNYGVNVQKAVFDRMRSDRSQIAQKYRAEGSEQRARWDGRIEQEQNEILSEADREAERIKGEGDAEAARIYAQAYGADPEFYAFWKTLQIYRDNLGSNSTLVVSTDSDLFQYLRKAGLVPTASTAE